MTFSGDLITGDELHPYFFGALGQLAQHPLAVAHLVIILALVYSSPLVSMV